MGENSSPETSTLDEAKIKNEIRPLCGFLNKLSEGNFVKSFYTNTLSRRRWFIFSESNCKLYYYKHKNDIEPMGIIDVANCTFTYDLEDGNDTQFVVRSGGKDIVLEASSSQERLYWLQQLQIGRREYNLKVGLNSDGPNSKRLSIIKPNQGLIQQTEEDIAIDSDPTKDLILQVSRPVECDESDVNEARSYLSSLPALPLKLFRNSGVSSLSQLSSPDSEVKSTVLPRQESHSFDRIGQRFRNSLKLRSRKSLEMDSYFDEREKINCTSCIKFQEKLNTAETEVSNLKDSCDAYREAVDSLQKRIGGLESQKTTIENMNQISLTDGDIIGILREKDNRIVDLELGRQKLFNSLHRLTSDLRDSRIHSEQMEDKLSMVTALVQAKDKGILSITSELTRLKEGSGASASESQCQRETTTIATQTSYSEYESMKDMLEGYKNQNRFLNKEILDLHALHEQFKDRERKLISESTDWEAKFYQIQSKYLLLLNDLHSPQSTNQDADVISQLLHDLVESSGTTDLRGVCKHGKEYDEFGFCMSAPKEFDIHAKASFLQIQSKTLASQAEHASMSASLERKWESFIASTTSKDLLLQQELKYLIRQGIPYQYKGRVWSSLINSRVSSYKADLPVNYYQTLLVEIPSCTTTNVIVKQIEIDLLRTLPNNWHYQTLHSDGIPKLRRVLLAYSRRNADVAYCQGLNRLAAIALLFLKEEDAFWCLVYIIECLMPPNFYGKSLLGSQVDQRVMKDLIATKLPNLASHFEQHGLDISLFTFNWFLCIFIDVIPHSIYLYIWDCFLYEGPKVLFRFSLAILKLCEDTILHKRDYLSILDYLRSVPEPVLDMQRLQHAAFKWANPLSLRYIQSRREYHTTVVEAELKAVEKLRKLYRNEEKRDDIEAKDCSEMGARDDDEVEHWEIIGLDPPMMKKMQITTDKDSQQEQQQQQDLEIRPQEGLMQENMDSVSVDEIGDQAIDENHLNGNIVVETSPSANENSPLDIKVASDTTTL